MRRLGLNASCERRVEAVPLKPGAIPGPINSAHRSFVAFEIFALAAADITRFFPPVVLPLLRPDALPLLPDPRCSPNRPFDRLLFEPCPLENR